jgi:hypothetical protein
MVAIFGPSLAADIYSRSRLAISFVAVRMPVIDAVTLNGFPIVLVMIRVPVSDGSCWYETNIQMGFC